MYKSPFRTIVGFFVRVGAFYALLLSPWHGLMDAYRVVFRAMGNVTMPRLGGGDAGAQFVPFSTATHGADTSVRILNRKSGASGSIDIKSGFLGFRPTAFLVSLILATPIPRSRRAVALLLGGLCVSLFVLLRIWLQLADMLSNPSPLRVYELSAFWKSMLTMGLKVLVLSPPSGYIVPGIIWALVSFRGEDWDRILGNTIEESDTASDRRHTPTARPRKERGSHRRGE